MSPNSTKTSSWSREYAVVFVTSYMSSKNSLCFICNDVKLVLFMSNIENVPLSSFWRKIDAYLNFVTFVKRTGNRITAILSFVSIFINLSTNVVSTPKVFYATVNHSLNSKFYTD